MRRGFHISFHLSEALISTGSTPRHFPRAGGVHQCRRDAALFTFIRRLSTTTDKDSEESFIHLFNKRPVAERAAAMSIARRHSNDDVSLKTFVEELPKVTRDEVFRRGMRVEHWVEESPLFRLVEDASGARSVRLAGRADCLLDDSDPIHDTGSDNNNNNNNNNKNNNNNNNKNNNNSEAEVVGKFSPRPAPDATVEERLIQILRQRVLCPEGGQSRGGATGPDYKALNDAFTSLLREASGLEVPEMVRNAAATLKYAQFINLLQSPRGREECWVLNEKYVCARGPGETQPPRFVSPQPRTISASSLNNYGGWGAASNVPTRQDVYEILKYIPLNWGNFGSINLPAAVKKKHIRIASTLMWFRRQPFYFELRNVAGTTEIRRSITLHPEAHGFTPEEAHERLQLMIARGEANSLVPTGVDGGIISSDDSLQTVALVKFIARVCPGYFVTPQLIMQRYTKKNLTVQELVACAQSRPDEFEVVHSKYSDTTLIRKRIGADSSRWKDDFLEDLDRFPEDVRGLIILMGRVCSTWDRPQYVYVRLTEEEKSIVGGYNGMMKILQRHPQVFRNGKVFIARVDLCDPLSLKEPEPNPDDMTTRVIIRDENPYLTPYDLAVVFHYVAPDDEPSTASFFAQCSSPAMRAVLPSRIVTVLQLFPKLFLCKETSPGVFSIRKVKQTVKRPVDFGNSDPHLVMQKETQGETLDSHSGDTDESFDADFAENDILSREETIQTVKSLIPPNGVEASQLLLWASIGVQQAASHHYGGILKLVESNRTHFKVQDSPEMKMIYVKNE